MQQNLSFQQQFNHSKAVLNSFRRGGKFTA